MKIYLIGIHYENKSSNIRGFRLFDVDNKKIMDVPYNSVLEAVKNKKIEIEGIEECNGSLRGSNGSFDRYTKIINGKVKNKAFVIINEIGSEGYTVSDWNGTLKKLRSDDVIKLADGIGIANSKLVKKDNTKPFMSAINGNYETVEIKENANVNNTKTLSDEEKEARKKAREALKRKSNEALTSEYRITGRRALGENSKLGEIDKKTGMTVEQKLAKCLLDIRNIRGFYYSILANTNKIESNEVATMGVTIKNLYFNSEFIKGLTNGELTFIYMHEALHIAMQHKIRELARDHTLWNVACDYYVNKVIQQEFDLTPGEEKKVNGIATVTLPTFVLYNNKVDIEKDTPEGIYNELMSEVSKQKNKETQEQDGEGQGQGQDGEGQDGEGQGQGQDGEGQDGEGQDGEGQDGKGSNGKKKQVKSSDVSNNDSNSNNDENKDKNKDATAIENSKFRDKKIGKIRIKDIIDDEESRQMSDAQKQQTSKTLIERAVTLQKQIGTFGGEQGSFFERYVEKALAPKVDWRTLLRNKLNMCRSTISTYSSPDRRFLGRGSIIPGPKVIENNAIENLKICIDTSGSISDKDLGIAIAQIEQLLKRFEAKAEVIYWDTKVRSVAPFTNMRELVKIKPDGGGGTDVNCVFESFEEGDYKNHKRPKPSIIVVITDGEFTTVKERFKKYKDTIWIINDEACHERFKTPFGTKAKLKPND